MIKYRLKDALALSLSVAIVIIIALKVILSLPKLHITSLKTVFAGAVMFTTFTVLLIILG